MIIDRYNRVHNYLRISLTDNCNLRCFYCMPDEDYVFTPASQLMQPTEVEELARIFVEQGVNKIRLTGGEPLVRKDAGDIIHRLSKFPVELTMTTNATRIHHFIDQIVMAGIRSLNVSLDTLQADRFNLMTRRDNFELVKGNIDLLLRKGIHVKVNCVVMRSLNDEEINDFIEWTRLKPIEVRFIEFMPFSGNRWSSNKVFTLQEILDRVRSKYEVVADHNDITDTSKKYHVPGHAGSFAVISTMSQPFCSGCNRMRLTADGKLKNCLFSKHETDLLSALRAGNAVLPLIHQCILDKAKELGGQFDNNFNELQPEAIDNRPMITIGG